MLDTPLPGVPRSHYYHSVRGEFYFVWPDSLEPLRPRNDTGKDLFGQWRSYSDEHGLRFDDVSISINYFIGDSLEVAAKRFSSIISNPSYVDTSYILIMGNSDTLFCMESKKRCGNIQLTDPPCKQYWILLPNCRGCEVSAATNATDSLSRAKLFGLAVLVSSSIRFTPP